MSKNRVVGGNPRSLSQFFEGDDARLSMTRLLCFLSFWPASYVVVVTQSHEALGWYLSSYTGAYVGGKGVEIWKKRKTHAPISDR